MYVRSKRTPSPGEEIKIEYNNEKKNETGYQPYYVVYCICDNCKFNFDPAKCYHFDFLLTLMCSDKNLKIDQESEILTVPKPAFAWFLRQLVSKKIKHSFNIQTLMINQA